MLQLPLGPRWGTRPPACHAARSCALCGCCVRSCLRFVDAAVQGQGSHWTSQVVLWACRCQWLSKACLCAPLGILCLWTSPMRKTRRRLGRLASRCACLDAEHYPSSPRTLPLPHRMGMKFWWTKLAVPWARGVTSSAIKNCLLHARHIPRHTITHQAAAKLSAVHSQAASMLHGCVGWPPWRQIYRLSAGCILATRLATPSYLAIVPCQLCSSSSQRCCSSQNKS